VAAYLLQQSQQAPLTTGDGASISLSQQSCVSAQQLSAAR
jgi:hypothetical protein